MMFCSGEVGEKCGDDTMKALAEVVVVFLSSEEEEEECFRLR